MPSLVCMLKRETVVFLGLLLGACHPTQRVVLGVGEAPTGSTEAISFTSPGTFHLKEGDSWSHALATHFRSTHTLGYACVGECPAGLTIDPASGLMRWTPERGQAKDYDVEVAAAGGGYSKTASIAFSVAKGNALLFAITEPASGNSLHSSSSLAAVRGVCEKSVTNIRANVAGDVVNSCASQGTFLFLHRATASGDVAVSLEAGSETGLKANASATLSFRLEAPGLAITSPEDVLYTEATSVVLSGTCSTQVRSLEANPALTFTDSDCSDGTWSAGPFVPTWSRKLVTITATDAAGNRTSASQRILKTIVLGQPNLDILTHRTLGLAGPGGVWTDGTRLVVADTNNNRVLIWHTFPGAPSTPPHVVLGQKNLSLVDPLNNGASAATLNAPTGVFVHQDRLLVGDTGNNRVLIWNSFPTRNAQPADVVVGQPHLEATGSNSAGGVSARTLSSPSGLWTDGTRLVIADEGNSRVLVWNTFPTSHQTPADLVLGQADMTTRTSNAGTFGEKSLAIPRFVWVEGTKLLVADPGNQRILIWNSFPASNNEGASVVLGQPDMVTKGTYTGGVSLRSFGGVGGIAVAEGKLFATDPSGNRILVWNAIPTSNFAPADFVLGQTHPAHLMRNSPNGMPSAAGLNGPRGLSLGGSRLVVADQNNNRVLVWNSIPAATQPADGVVGQAGFGAGVEVLGLKVHISSYFYPYLIGEKFLLADRGNHRVLIWNTLPHKGDIPPDVVLGQPDEFQTLENNGGIGSATLKEPMGIHYDGTRLYVADRGNNRVLIWNEFPTTNFEPADVILGQPDAATNTAGTTDAKLSAPIAVAVDTASTPPKLFVTDQANHRILIWNGIPTVTGTAASGVLGQANFTTGTLNGGVGVSASTLASPAGIAIADGKLFVADSDNHRVLIWNTIPAVQTAANLVLGQTAFNVRTANTGGRGPATMNAPAFVSAANGRLVVSDTINHRLLLWDTLPTTHGEAPDNVLGQLSFSSAAANPQYIAGSPYAYAVQALNAPAGVHFDGTRLVAADINNVTLKLWNRWPTKIHAPADLSFTGQSTRAPQDGVATSARNVGKWGTAIVAGEKLVLADCSNNRLLIWNTIPEQSHAPADGVVGQPDLNSGRPNWGGVSPHSFSCPNYLWSDGQKLLVADSGNNRVLLWKSFPTRNDSPADIVLGQPDFSSSLRNNGGLSLSTLFSPTGVWMAAGRIFVADQYNNRVLIWNTIPSSNGAPADVVIGQPDGESNRPNPFGVSQDSLALPRHVAATASRMWVADQANNRVLGWNTIPTSDHTLPDYVLGQPSFSAITYPEGSPLQPSGRTLRTPYMLWPLGQKLYVADASNNRIVGFDTFETFASATEVLLQPHLNSNKTGLGGRLTNLVHGIAFGQDFVVVSEANRNRVLIVAK